MYESIKEEVCEEHFEKVCQINFVKKAVKGIVKKCYNPFEKICDGTGPETCKTFHETSCTTKYEGTGRNGLARYGKDKNQRQRPNQGGDNFFQGQPQRSFDNRGEENNFINERRNNGSNTGENLLGVTKCEKVPVKLCGRGCRVVQRGEKCYNREVDDLRNVPEEQCELNPKKSCQNVSKLVPKLKPVLECSLVPKEFCSLKYGPPRKVTNRQKSIWCLDEE